MQYYTIFYVQFLTTYQCNHYFSLFLFEFKKISTIIIFILYSLLKTALN